LIFIQTSRRDSQLMKHHQCQRHWWKIEKCLQKVSRARFSQSVADTEQESVQTMTSFLRTVHHDGEFSPAWWGWNGARPSFHSIYHHEQSCGVRSSWEGRYTPHFTSTQFYSVVPDAVVRWVANIPSWNFEKSTTRDSVPLMASRMIV